MIASGVENAEHNDCPAFNFVEKLVRKTFCQDATKTAVINREAFGSVLQTGKGIRYREEEFISQSLSLVIVPIASLLNVVLSR